MSFKGGMVNYYHEARAQVKKIKTLQEDNKRRAERRAELIAPVAPDPLQQLAASGTSCKLFRGAEAHATNEAGDNLVPWNGDSSNMIDRFDVRALLDFYKEPDPRVLAARQKSNEELKLEETLRFESYRDLVRLMARGLSEAQGLQLVDQESLERRAQQHAAMQAATDAVYNNPKPGGAAASGPGTSGPGGLPTGSGVYSTIGFSYDTGTGGPGPGAATGADSSSDDSDSDSDSDSDDEGTGLGPVSEAELAQEAEDDRVDEMAEGFGLEDFSYRLHKSLEKEGEDEARMRKPPRRRTGRKRARMRAKRMTGQGLNPATGLPFAKHDPYKDPTRLVNPWEDSRQRGRADSPERLPGRRNSPSYDAAGWRRADSPGAGGERQYITEFTSGAEAAADTGHRDSKAQVASASIIDALPDRPDPAQWGGMQPVAAAALTVHGIKHDDLHRRLRTAAQEDDSPIYRARSRSRSRSRGHRQRAATPPRHRVRSRSRSRHRDRSRSRSRSRVMSRDRSRGLFSRRHSRSRSRDRDRDRDRNGDRSRHRSSHRRRSRSSSRSRSRSRGRHGERDEKRRRSGDGGPHGSSKRTSGAGGASAGSRGSSGTGAKSAAAANKAPTSTAAAAAAAKETPQERLKRLMQAQLNKAAQKDSLAVAQRKIQLEKDKVARQQIERVALAAGRHRRHRRSPSPGGSDDSRDHYR